MHEVVCLVSTVIKFPTGMFVLFCFLSRGGQPSLSLNQHTAFSSATEMDARP